MAHRRRRPWVLILSGPSSSGKTALARELHRGLPEPAYLFVADDTFPSEPVGSRAEPPTAEPAVVVFHRAIAQWPASGRNIIIDGALPYGDHALRQACLDELRDFDTHVVAVGCSVKELRRREKERPDPRPAGWAEQQALDINDGLPITAYVDTTTSSAVEAAIDAVDQLTAAGVFRARPR